MIHLIDKWAICSRGHYVYDRSTCAHCDETKGILPTVPYKIINRQLFLVKGQNLHPMKLGDVMNGWLADRKPPTGWMLYYLTFVEDGVQYWKIGISQKPYERLYREVAPTILDLKYMGSKEDAYREEQRLIRLYNPHLIKMNIPRVKKIGNTEIFDRDVLNGSLK